MTAKNVTIGKRTITGGLLVLLLLLCSISTAAQDVRRLLEGGETTVTVYGERLPLLEKKVLSAPLNITVITRQEIKDSGATTIQELLAQAPGVFLHNQTGNPSESTVEIRGFPRGTSLAVFLDGVRLNNIQDNSVDWQTIPLEDVERIEIYRGAAGPLYGGGALSGVVNIITRKAPAIPRLDFKGAVGSFGAREARVHLAGSKGPVEFYGAAMERHSKGWRENDGYHLDDGILSLKYHLSDNQSVAFLAKYSGGAESDPGALTGAELMRDPRQSPYNKYDGSRERHRLAALTYNNSVSGGWAFSGQLYSRANDRDILSSGRSGYGFFTRGRENYSGLTAEARNAGRKGGCVWQVSCGTEVSSGRFSGRGFFSDVKGRFKSPASSTKIKEYLSGFYAQTDLGFGPLHFIGGARTDRARYDYSDFFTPANDTERVFKESTWRAGSVYHTSDASSLFLTYSEGYKIPSVVDLFAYPGFYSNPDLRTTRASDWELGWRYLKGAASFKVAAFNMKIRDEVVFVLTQPLYFIGQNRNIGRSYRRGFEAAARRPLPAGFELFASGSYQDAEVTAGPYDGKRIPMSPRYQGTAGALWANPSWTVRLATGWVGPQLLDSDLKGKRPGLPGYATVDLALTYRHRALTVDASVSNALDRSYVSRGITNGYSDYFTPAYPASYRLALTWSF